MKTNKLTHLKSELNKYSKLAVAFSGGIDSTLLLHLAAQVVGNKNVVAITGFDDIFFENDLSFIKEYTKQNNIKLAVIKTNQLVNKKFISNGYDRCYHCRKLLFAEMKKAALKFKADVLLDGSNQDDLLDYRPGRKAAEELGIISPFISASITKKEIRTLSKSEKIKIWEKPSSPCAATRIAYGLEINKVRLKRIKQLEEMLWNMGFLHVRLRDHGDIARIEVPKNTISKLINHKDFDKIVNEIKAKGFFWVTVDASGFESGSMNKSLSSDKL